MKVLFAVSNESISEGIVKQYQQEYKEILSYKNVYYFNAILKEIQKDKTYDRIIISEELEPFSNNNYEQIDKFLFEKLDNISDEAQDSNGQETSIIFICTDRRTKGSNFLVKLFSIGVYNALLGQDRVKSEVCKLINKPRIKKEAKTYYGIDAEDAKYDQTSDSEVTELEINNIRNHFRKLGKNTEKYAESFDNIAVQYNEEQLRIIINCLPINVKAVLEANSPKYQELMNASAGKIKSVAGQEMELQARQSGITVDLMQNVQSKIDKPIVIPSSVKRRTVPTGPVQSTSQATGTVKRTVIAGNRPTPQNVAPIAPSAPVQETSQVQNTVVSQPVQRPVRPVRQVQQPVKQTVQPQVPVQNEPVQNEDIFDDINDLLDDDILGSNTNNNDLDLLNDTNDTMSVNDTTNVETVEDNNDLLGLDNEFTDDFGMSDLDNFEMLDDSLPGLDDNFETDDLLGEVQDTVNNTDTIDTADNSFGELPDLDDSADDLDLLGLDDDLITPEPQNVVTEPVVNTVEETLPGLDDTDDLDDLLGDTETVTETPVTENPLPVKKGRGRPRKIVTEPPKPKGKRGRPRKVVAEDGTEYDEEDEYTDEVDLPGLDELDDFEDFDMGDNSFNNTQVASGDDVLAGLDDLDDITSNDTDNILPGMDFEDNTLETTDDIFGGIDTNIETNNNDDFGDGVLPGFDDFDDGLDGVLPGFDDNEIPGLDDVGITDTNSLPGFDDDDLLTTFDEPVATANTVAPVNNEIQNINNNVNTVQENTAIESIKSNIDYSMSTLNSLLTKENKIVTFIGTTKNGTSFLVNNLALLFDSLGINTAILDMTKNRNSYYIYTNSDEELRNISANAMENLERGVAKGLRVKENLTVYTAIPDNGKVYNNAESILSTLVQNHSLILIDCDYDTDASFFASCQEIYLVQSMDVLTIQPLTAFLKGLKTKGVLEPEKIRIAINKHVRLKEFSAKDFIAGMSCYNDPSMSIMTELFNREMVKFCIIDFEEGVYAKYLDSMASCKVNLNGYSKSFIANLRKLGDMVYPLTGGTKQAYGKPTGGTSPVGYPQGQRNFSSSTSNTLDKMRKKY